MREEARWYWLGRGVRHGEAAGARPSEGACGLGLHPGRGLGLRPGIARLALGMLHCLCSEVVLESWRIR